MTTVLRSIRTSSGIPFKIETHTTHGFDPKTVQYVLVDIWDNPESNALLQVLPSWDICALTIDDYDYNNFESMRQFGFWVICRDSDTLMMLELKYKKYIRCVLSQEEMRLCIKTAKTFINNDTMRSVGSVLQAADRLNQL